MFIITNVGYTEHHFSPLLYLISTVLKFPISKSSPWFSARAKPNPTARNIRVRVTIRVNTKLIAHRSNLRHSTQDKLASIKKYIDKKKKVPRLTTLAIVRPNKASIK